MKMVVLYKLITASALALGMTTPAARKLTVVATTPDLGAIAREIGGDYVDVKVLAKPSEDPHFVDAKPSFVVMLNRADALIEGGADLEIGWLPPLLENARNSKIAAGSPGRIVASSGIRLLDVPSTLDRSRGDVHAAGNPHFLIDPANGKIVAAEVANHLAQLAPASANAFRNNLRAFDAAVDAKTAEWENLMAPYKGAKVITYHNDFIYFAQRYGLQVAGTLEPKPGIAPSPAHLAQIIATMKSQNARVILVQPYQDRKTAQTVARQANGVVVDYSQQPGAFPNTDTYVALMDNLVRSIANGLRGGK